MALKLAHQNAVLLKGRKDGITIQLDAVMPFDELIVHFQRRVVDAKHFFEGAKSNISFTGRTLSEAEEKELLDIIMSETTLDIPFVASGSYKPLAPSFTTNTAPPHLPHNVHTTSYHQGGLRSGQSIHFNGSVVVLGDVNAGSEIVADGHIIVLGSLKGMAHAGCSGNENCFVSALVFAPTQLRIAGVITIMPNAKDTKKTPSCAYIQDGQVYIAPLLN